MRIRELFSADVTRDIPPVVYFHEQSPAKLAEEVREYIITGGYPDSDPRAKRLKGGIHEQLVHLLTAIHHELKLKKTGPELPACWISGFYGSGKSSFTKLLGLSLDGAKLPDGRLLSDAFLERDDSPRRQEAVEAWQKLRHFIDPIAVVFDIGGVARDNEHIHVAALRQIQARLGYCRDHYVAEHELKLERDGEWDRFLATAETVLKRSWRVAKDQQQADDHFSHVMHALEPDRYRDPMSWLDARAGSKTGAGTSVREVVDAIEAMLSIRAEGKALFIVIDEVSQYVHQDEDRMLKLQGFVSELGQRMKGGVWLLATGQQKLDESGSHTLNKLKDRFPPHLRVHLHPSNIRDVVHKRLLAKKPAHEAALREQFQRHRPDLKLHGYKCEEITEEDFLEVYPLLPGHVDLLMQITSNLRSHSSRVQGDDHAIRGLLQLLGELFRELKLGEKEVGELITLDAIFEVQHSALESDVQNTLTRIFNHDEVREDVLAVRAAKAVALLEQIQEQEPTTAKLVAQCLYSRLGEGNQEQAVSRALEKLRQLNLVSYSEKLGFKIQSSAGQEWKNERDGLGVTTEQIAEIISEKVRELLGKPERPRYKGRPFPIAAFFSDARHIVDRRVADSRDDSVVTFDFRFLRGKDDRTAATWTQRSSNELKDRIVWLIGEPDAIHTVAGEYGESAQMVKRYQPRRESLTKEKARLLLEEEARLEELEKKLQGAIADAFLEGQLYFRGQEHAPRSFGASFPIAVTAAAERVLPTLYPFVTDLAVTESELNQLLEKDLRGISPKLLDKGLGILTLDAGKYVPTCDGVVPARIVKHVEDSGGVSGSALLAHFGSPPYGFPVDVVRACLAGLLRGTKIRIRPEQGEEITSLIDPGARDLFRKDRDLRRADIFPAREGEIGVRERVAIRNFFKKALGVDLDNESDVLHEAAFNQFPQVRVRLRDLERRFNLLPGRPPLPKALEKLGGALEACLRSPHVEPTVKALHKNLDALQDGLQQLGMLGSELTDEAIASVKALAEVRDNHLAQLSEVGELGELGEVKQRIDEQLGSERPWREVAKLGGATEKTKDAYRTARRSLIARQSADAEAVLTGLKARPDFEKLPFEQAQSALKPVRDAVFNTSEDALAPTLSAMKARFPLQLHEAELKAAAALDALLSSVTDKPVVPFESKLRGRELKSRDELKAMLQELEDRIGPQLDKGVRIRIV